MNKLKSVFAVLISSFFVFATNKYYSPKNIKDLLKWRGIKLASSDNSWRSVFYENKDELSKIGIKSHKELWNWCSEKLKQSNLLDEILVKEAEKFCTDNATSIFGRVIRDGEENKVIHSQDHESFAINYAISGLSKDVLKLLGLSEEHRQNFNYIGLKISEWCYKNKSRKIIGKEGLDLFKNFKKRCYQRGVKNVSQLLSKEGVNTVLNTDFYNKRFKDELINVPLFFEELKGYIKNRRENKIKAQQSYYETRKQIVNLDKEELESWNSKEIEKINEEIPEQLEDATIKASGGKFLKWWCEDRFKASLLETGMFPYNYSKIRYRCTEKS